MSTNVTTGPSPDGLNGTVPTNGTDLPPLGPPYPPIPISEWAAYLSKVYLGLTSVLMLLAISVFITRMYQRVRPVWKVGLDDYFIVGGMLLTITDWGLLMPMMVPQGGFMAFEDGLNSGKHSWIAIGVWGLSMTCIKVSVCLTLLRIQGKERSWRIFLYTIMAVQSTYGVLNLFFNLVIACRPLQAAWDFTIIEKQCVSVEVMRLASNIGSGINITTDVLLSLAPGVFLRKLNRPLRERIFVCVLMGLGLLASISSVVKTVIVQGWGDLASTDDFWAQGISISTYTVLEQQTGILAACVPAMKNILQKGLSKFGVSLHDSRTGGRSGYYLKNRSGAGAGNGTSHFHSQNGMGSQMGSRYARGGKDDTIDEDEEKCLEMPEMRRNLSTPKSQRTGSGSFHHGVGGDYKTAGLVHEEQLPAHAV